MSDFSVFYLSWLFLTNLVTEVQFSQHVCEHRLQALFESIALMPFQSLLFCYMLCSQTMPLLPLLLSALWVCGINPSRRFRLPFSASCRYTCIRCHDQLQLSGLLLIWLDSHNMTIKLCSLYLLSRSCACSGNSVKFLQFIILKKYRASPCFSCHYFSFQSSDKNYSKLFCIVNVSFLLISHIVPYFRLIQAYCTHIKSSC